MAIPFALWAPLFMIFMVSTIEIGTVTIRHTSLERALDQTVRSIRLTTGTHLTHEQLKRSICTLARVLPNCMTTLHLEMITVNMRDFHEPDYYPDCVDVAQDVTPLRNFEFGMANEVMFMRACYLYNPFSPAGYLGGAMTTDVGGNIALVASSAFVQEPN